MISNPHTRLTSENPALQAVMARLRQFGTARRHKSRPSVLSVLSSVTDTNMRIPAICDATYGELDTENHLLDHRK